MLNIVNQQRSPTPRTKYADRLSNDNFDRHLSAIALLREILLYYVDPGETCMMSLSACFFNNKSPSQAVAIEPSLVLSVATGYITKWQKEYSSWNDFVIRTFRNRYDELLSAFESVAFDHIHTRVLEYLTNRIAREKKDQIEISHQELANQLGTTRVVISRILKQLETEPSKR